MERLYEENPHQGDGYRATVLDELKGIIARRIKEAQSVRQAYFTPDYSSVETYSRTTEEYRQQYKQHYP